MSLQRLREALAIAFLVLLPFHAFGITVLTRIIAGPGHAPLPQLAIWKEGLLAIIVAIAMVEFLGQRLRHRARIHFDAIDACITLLGIIAVVYGINDKVLFTQRFLYGLRYDVLLPACFLLLRRVPWSVHWSAAVVRLLPLTGVLVVLLGSIGLLLPLPVLTALGYSDMHSLYDAGGALAPYQQLGESAVRRMQSVMSGPNQLGLWLLLPYAVLLHAVLGRSIGTVRSLWAAIAAKPWHAAGFLIIDVGIGLTFSRAAWMAATVIVLVMLRRACTRRFFLKVLGCLLCIAALGIALLLAVAPQTLLRATSNRGHIERPLAAMRIIKAHPLGLGLGAAGPAAHRGRPTCVELPAGSDASWAAVHQNLCVFVGGAQVQPKGDACDCPLLPENWYLQIGVELGVLGMTLFLALVLLLLLRMRDDVPIFLAFLGVALAGLFLHSFEDFGVAATLWLLAAAARNAREPV